MMWNIAPGFQRIGAFFFLSIPLLLSVSSCSGLNTQYLIDSDMNLKQHIDKEGFDYPDMKFIVFSDAHLFAPSNGTSGEALDEYLANDRKLIIESEEILQEMVNQSAEIEADFVLVTGDLTKDGELSSHQLMASYLRKIESHNKKVYVIPGNHDILNGLAVRYEGDQTYPIDNVDPHQFAEIYADYGFAEALYADANSLSYIVEPVEGLWLFALDSNRYNENKPGEEHIIDGAFSDGTMKWLEDKLLLSLKEQKAVIVMMHHGVLEHYKGQEKYYGDYIIDDYQKVSQLLARYNARLVFTGHYHAQDITLARWSDHDKYLFDIETGSLLTYPNPFRIVTITNEQQVEIQSEHILSIPTHPDDFPAYAYQFAHNGITGIASRTIQQFKGSPDEGEIIGSQVADAFLAHYYGDEDLESAGEYLTTKGLSIPAMLVVTTQKDLVDGLWRDLEPPDNSLKINLPDGSWE